MATQESNPETRAQPETVVISFAALFFYLAHLSRNYNADGAVFAFFLGRAAYAGEIHPLFHPHHLLYLPMAYPLQKALLALGLQIGPMTVLQVLDAVLAALAVFLFHRLCIGQIRDRFVSAAAAASLASAFSFVRFATDAEVYILETFLLLLGFSILDRLTRARKKPGWALSALAIGAGGGLAAGGHLAAGLFLFPCGLGALLFLRPAPTAIKRLLAGAAPAAAASAAGLFLLAALYAAAYQIQPASAGSFSNWVLTGVRTNEGGHRDNYWSVSPAAAPSAVRGYAEGLVGGPDYWREDGPVTATVRKFLLAFYALSLIGYLALLPRFLGRDPRPHLLLLATLIPQALFNSIYAPSSLEIKTPLHSFFFLAAAFALAELKPAGKPGRRAALNAAALAFTALLFLHNFATAVRPNTREENNPDLLRTWFIRDHTEGNAAIYIAGTVGEYTHGKFYLPYFAGRQARVVNWIMGENPDGPLRALTLSLLADRERPVYATMDLLESGRSLRNLEKHHGVPAEKVKGLFRSLSPRAAARMDDGFTLHRLDPSRLALPRGP